jgi:hypothetical protein
MLLLSVERPTILPPRPRSGLSGPQERPCGARIGPGGTHPCRPHLLASEGVIWADACLPEFLSLVWIWPPILRYPSTNEPVELAVYPISACYVHQAPFTCSTVLSASGEDMAKRTSSLLCRPFPSFSWRSVFAAPRFHQLVESAVPLLSAPFGGLPGLPPLPTRAIALFAALRHSALHCGH